MRRPSALAVFFVILLVARSTPAQDACDYRQISEDPSNIAFNLDFDGSRIALVLGDDPTGGNPDGNFEIFLWDGSTITQVTSSTTGNSGNLGPISLNSGSIAFSSTADLTGGNPEGNAEVFLWDGSMITQITSSATGDAAATSLDGNALAFASTADLKGGNADGSSEIFLWDGSMVTQITSSSGDSRHPSLMGGAIAFSSNADLTGANPEGNFEVFLWDGSTTTQITDSTTGDSGDTPPVSLDGGSIAFSSDADLTGDNPGGSNEIFLWDGSTINQISAAGGNAFEPSLDDAAVAFTETGGIQFFDGEALFQIAPSGTASSVPSLVGNTLAFYSTADLTGENADGSWEVYLATCEEQVSVLEIPTVGVAGLVVLLCLIALAGAVLLRWF